MKLLLKIFLLVLFVSQSMAQSDFDNKLNALSDSIADKINSELKKKIAVWDFTDSDGNITKLGKYLSEEISVNLANDAKGFSVMDRNHLATILREHKLNAEGYIDQKTAKELGQWVAVDAIITGNITVFTNKIKLTMKVLDTETALIIAAVKGDLPINDEVASFIGVPGMGSQNSNANSNRGFNRPLNSGEQYNNPETVNKECETNNSGDYCFTNNTSQNIKVIVYLDKFSRPQNCNGKRNEMQLAPGQTQCFYSLCADAFKYDVQSQKSSVFFLNYTKGQILVEICKSKTQIIN